MFVKNTFKKSEDVKYDIYNSTKDQYDRTFKIYNTVTLTEFKNTQIANGWNTTDTLIAYPNFLRYDIYTYQDGEITLSKMHKDDILPFMLKDIAYPRFIYTNVKASDNINNFKN